jgi:hypothetical protein
MEKEWNITRQQYDRWIKNMSKNKTGTSWIYFVENNNNLPLKLKLYKDDENNLYFIWNGIDNVYLKIKEN